MRELLSLITCSLCSHPISTGPRQPISLRLQPTLSTDFSPGGLSGIGPLTAKNFNAANKLLLQAMGLKAMFPAVVGIIINVLYINPFNCPRRDNLEVDIHTLACSPLTAYRTITGHRNQEP